MRQLFTTLEDRDPALSCALALVRAGSVDGFVASLADSVP